MEAHLAPGTAVFVIGEADLGAEGGGTLTDNGEPEPVTGDHFRLFLCKPLQLLFGKPAAIVRNHQNKMALLHRKFQRNETSGRIVTDTVADQVAEHAGKDCLAA